MNRILSIIILMLLTVQVSQAQVCTGAKQLRTGRGATQWMEAYGNNRLYFGGVYYASSQSYFAFDGDTLRHAAGDLATVFVIETDTLFNRIRMFNACGFNSLGGPFNDVRVWSMAVDKRGDVLFTGSFAQDTLVYGADTVYSDTYQEGFLVKADSSGTPLLLKSFGSRSFSGGYHYEDRGRAVATDFANNIYIAAGFDGDYLEINGDTVHNGLPVGLNSSTQSAVIALTPNGQTRWLKAFGSPGPDDAPLGIDADSAGNVTVCGSTTASANTFYFGPFSHQYKYSPNGYQAYTVRYDNTGAEQWLIPMETYVGTGPDVNAYDVATDNQGNSYVTGIFDYYAVFGGDTIYSPYATSAYLMKINAGGQKQFVRLGNSQATYNYPASVKLRGNKVFITGQAFTNNLAFDHLSLCCSVKSYFAMYDTLGTLQWLKGITTIGSTNVVSYACAVSTRGTVYACGSASAGQFNIEPLTATASSNGDYFMIRFGTLVSNGLTVSLINNTADTINCGLAVSLHAQAAGPANISYFWSADNDTIPGTFFTANTSGSPKTTTTYYVEAYSGGCVATDSARVVVIPIHVDAGTDTVICEGQSVQLQGNTLNNVNGYNWTPGSSLNTDSVHNPVATPAQSTSYIYTIRSQGCVNSDTVNVIVNPLAVANLSISALLLTVTVNNLSQFGTYYLVSYGDGTVDSVTSAGITTHTYANGGDYTICITAVNDCNTDVECAVILVSPVGIGTVNSAAYSITDYNREWVITAMHSVSGYNIELADGNGRLVRKMYSKEPVFNVSKDGLNSGLYYIRIYNAEAARTFKGTVIK